MCEVLCLALMGQEKLWHTLGKHTFVRSISAVRLELKKVRSWPNTSIVSSLASVRDEVLVSSALGSSCKTCEAPTLLQRP